MWLEFAVSPTHPYLRDGCGELLAALLPLLCISKVGLIEGRWVKGCQVTQVKFQLASIFVPVGCV